MNNSLNYHRKSPSVSAKIIPERSAPDEDGIGGIGVVLITPNPIRPRSGRREVRSVPGKRRGIRRFLESWAAV